MGLCSGLPSPSALGKSLLDPRRINVRNRGRQRANASAGAYLSLIYSSSQPQSPVWVGGMRDSAASFHGHSVPYTLVSVSTLFAKALGPGLGCVGEVGREVGDAASNR